MLRLLGELTRRWTSLCNDFFKVPVAASSSVFASGGEFHRKYESREASWNWSSDLAGSIKYKNLGEHRTATSTSFTLSS